MASSWPRPDGVTFVKNLLVPMSDGTRLALDMHVPPGDGPFPLVLEYIPYRKDDQPPFAGKHHYFAQHGYIGARLDVRGTGASEGSSTDEYLPVETRDGYDAIEWLAAQEWCTGKVAMTGNSYGGFTCVQVAALQPPHLTTVIPMNFTDDRYTDDCHYRGGVLRCYYDVGHYGSMMIGMNAMPPYPEVSGADWARIWEEHLSGSTPYILSWLEHQTDGAYWRSGSVRGRYDQIRCSLLMIGGWRDGYCNVPLRMSQHLSAPHRVLVGPWNHSGPDSVTPGPAVDYLHEIVRWCDYWLKGKQNGVMDDPRITVYMQGYDEPLADRSHTSGYWRAERSFPVEGVRYTEYALKDGGRLLPGGAAAPRPGDAWDGFEYRPTVGIAGGLWSGGVPFGLPTDQRADEAYSLNYTTEPLETPLEIIGMPRAVLHVSSTAPVMTFVARLSDVAPDGTSALITTGALNGTRRSSLVDPQPMRPGEVYELDVALDTTAWRFERGHRVRLSVSSADFPNLWPTPYNGTNRLYRDRAHPSRLVLPTVPSRPPSEGGMPAGEARFLEPPSPRRVYQPAPGEVPWEVTRDLLGDRTGLRTSTRSTTRPSYSTEVRRSEGLEVWGSNRDPADVVATAKYHWQVARSDGVTDVETLCTIRSTRECFHLVIELDVKVNGMPHHQRRWVRTFPRVLL